MNNDLNSALALFRSLYKAQKGDVYTIIERFILVGVKSRGLMSFSREEIVELLKESFNLDIPFSVISKCIIAYQDVFQYKAGKYIVINPMDSEIDQIISEMDEIEDYKESIIKELVSFVEKKQNTILTSKDRAELTRYFFDFIATSSISFLPDSTIARCVKRPIRPYPLIATRTTIFIFLYKKQLPLK